ncbi:MULTISPECIES: ABC transporter permease [Anoxybacillus]|uniref:Uncharacterized protein n=2 Tax=Anoxybacillaceae TaxID=3120669 RepID=A0A178T9E8_9BACL|nr:FtsX-like permease family protein [Anoxybacillus flavithermus]ASA97156.1 ABC transporter permease [Anoxybacillus flavithermus]MBE2905173.1 ABC transporter permease [Anoxybacillus flavithermus]MBE2909037.1 ABC transporter permease [Anoxybacillus flavithermus]MBE2911734.1 ABC transporter permease [Anoxybacillus flavithermus]MBE2912989.1 ABC transporter permease [Anoxybacillus flavithermus]
MSFQSFKSQWRAHPFTTAFAVLGLVISLLMISIGISSINYSHLLQRQLEQYAPPHATKLMVTFSHEPTWNDLFRLFDNIDQETGIILEGVALLHDGMPIMVTPEHVRESVEPRLPIKEGRYFTEKEIRTGEKVALIGSEWEKDTTIIGNERYIVLSGERYKCIGIIGLTGENSRLLDSQVLIPMTSLPPSVISKLLSQQQITLTLYNAKKDTYKDEKSIRMQAEKLFPQASIDSFPYEAQLSFRIDIGDRLMLIVLIYLLSLVNVVNLSFYWVQERIYEIGIRKAFGYTNRDIVFMIFSEMVVLCSIAVVFGYGVQWLFQHIFEKWVGFPLRISLLHFSAAIGFVFCSSLIAIIVPAFRVFRVQPIHVIHKK